jgi:hypothetical protein
MSARTEVTEEMINATAGRFGSLLLVEIGAANMAEVVRRNAIDPKYASGSCASHDFCDANMVMAPAVGVTLGLSVDEVAQATADDESAASKLWNAAWARWRDGVPLEDPFLLVMTGALAKLTEAHGEVTGEVDYPGFLTLHYKGREYAAGDVNEFWGIDYQIDGAHIDSVETSVKSDAVDVDAIAAALWSGLQELDAKLGAPDA